MITCIFACSTNGVIGYDNKIPWDIPSDLKHFKDTTMGKITIMGRKTFESIGHPLPGRLNVVISSGPVKGADRVFSTLQDALSTYKGEDVFLIGGKRILEEGFEVADRVIVSEIPMIIQGKGVVEVSLYFKEFFHLVDSKSINNDGEFRYKILTFERHP